jgi:hypothetical protein
MIGAISALVVGLFWLENAWEVWDARGQPLTRFGNLASGYGLGVIAEIGISIALGVALLWLFVRLGSSKPLPHLIRAA